MGKIYSDTNWIIKVQGNEHPPVHVHVLHPEGRASIGIDGTVLNQGVPAKVIARAVQWISENIDVIQAEWTRMQNPPDRASQ